MSDSSRETPEKPYEESDPIGFSLEKNNITDDPNPSVISKTKEVIEDTDHASETTYPITIQMEDADGEDDRLLDKYEKAMQGWLY